MNKSLILKILFAIFVIGGGILVVMQDEPANPAGTVNEIQPLPDQ